MNRVIWRNRNQSPVSHCQSSDPCNMRRCASGVHLRSFRVLCPASQPLILADQGGICNQPRIRGSYQTLCVQYTRRAILFGAWVMCALRMPRRCLVRKRLQSLSSFWAERELVRPCTIVLEESIGPPMCYCRRPLQT